MRKKVEVLENHAHLLPVQIDIQLFAAGIPLLCDVDPLKDNRPGSRHLEHVQRTQESALPRARRPDNHHYIALVDVYRHPVKRFDSPFVIVFFKIYDLNQLIGRLHGASSFPEQQQAC